MSLRARLLGVLIALAALGLIALAAITYAEQRSFLTDRVDEQTRAAVSAVNHELEPNTFPGRPPVFPGGRPPGFPPVPPGGGPGRDGGPGGQVNLPPGTYGQRRDANGKVTATAVITY